MPDNEIFSGLIRLHVLYHASHEGLFGLGMIHELREHGYRIGPGTLYPLLMRMSDKGLVDAQWGEPVQPGRPARHLYRLTTARMFPSGSLNHVVLKPPGPT